MAKIKLTDAELEQLDIYIMELKQRTIKEFTNIINHSYLTNLFYIKSDYMYELNVKIEVVEKILKSIKSKLYGVKREEENGIMRDASASPELKKKFNKVLNSVFSELYAHIEKVKNIYKHQIIILQQLVKSHYSLADAKPVSLAFVRIEFKNMMKNFNFGGI